MEPLFDDETAEIYNDLLSAVKPTAAAADGTAAAADGTAAAADGTAAATGTVYTDFSCLFNSATMLNCSCTILLSVVAV